jgi:hypothetical protein
MSKRILNYTIGAKYKYPNCNKVFVLKEVREFVFIFECGHWCTDNVFEDLINIETGVPVYNDNQLKLFI